MDIIVIGQYENVTKAFRGEDDRDFSWSEFSILQSDDKTQHVIRYPKEIYTDISDVFYRQCDALVIVIPDDASEFKTSSNFIANVKKFLAERASSIGQKKCYVVLQSNPPAHAFSPAQRQSLQEQVDGIIGNTGVSRQTLHTIISELQHSQTPEELATDLLLPHSDPEPEANCFTGLARLLPFFGNSIKTRVIETDEDKLAKARLGTLQKKIFNMEWSCTSSRLFGYVVTLNPINPGETAKKRVVPPTVKQILNLMENACNGQIRYTEAEAKITKLIDTRLENPGWSGWLEALTTSDDEFSELSLSISSSSVRSFDSSSQ